MRYVASSGLSVSWKPALAKARCQAASALDAEWRRDSTGKATSEGSIVEALNSAARLRQCLCAVEWCLCSWSEEEECEDEDAADTDAAAADTDADDEEDESGGGGSSGGGRGASGSVEAASTCRCGAIAAGCRAP